MKKQKIKEFPIIQPNLQISFYNRLNVLKKFYLQDGMNYALSKIVISNLDKELGAYVSDAHLRKLAQFHIRGEVFFPVPILLLAHPYLLGYYRLLYGLSQKEFYGTSPYSRFKKLEESGIIPATISTDDIAGLCKVLNSTAGILIDNMDMLSVDMATHLQLLTLGAQLRGGNNNIIGEEATLEVVNLIKDITTKYIRAVEENRIFVVNDSGDEIVIEFLSDPDVRIIANLGIGVRPILSIEIKGGRDVSNVHNRMGEAEKSHQKAKKYGYREFWTLVRAGIDMDMARRESPTTNLFFRIDEILDQNTQEYKKFKELLCSFIGIKSKNI
jgi:hypothetical protein